MRGEFKEGERAACYGTETGYFTLVIDYLMNELIKRNYDIDWESYYNGIESGIFSFQS